MITNTPTVSFHDQKSIDSAVSTLIQAGFYEDALVLIIALDDIPTKLNSLIYLSRYYHSMMTIKDVKLARILLNLAHENTDQEDVLESIVSLLVGFKQFLFAEEVVTDLISDHYLQNRCFEVIVESLSRDQHYSDAARLVFNIPDEALRSRYLVDLVKEALKVGDTPIAERLIPMISLPYEQEDAIRLLIDTDFDSLLPSDIEHIIQRLDQAASSRLFGQLMIKLMQGEQNHDAIRIAKHVITPDAVVKVFQSEIIPLIWKEKLGDAISFVLAMDNDAARLCLGLALITIGEYEQAQTLTPQISDSAMRDVLWVGVTKGWSSIGDFERAKRAFNMIHGPKKQVHALWILGADASHFSQPSLASTYLTQAEKLLKQMLDALHSAPQESGLSQKFKEVEFKAKALRHSYQTGKLTRDDYEERLRELMILDDDQVWWIVGTETDQWYRYDQASEQWIPEISSLDVYDENQLVQLLTDTFEEIGESDRAKSLKDDIDAALTVVSTEVDSSTYYRSDPGLNRLDLISSMIDDGHHKSAYQIIDYLDQNDFRFESWLAALAKKWTDVQQFAYTLKLLKRIENAMWRNSVLTYLAEALYKEGAYAKGDQVMKQVASDDPFSRQSVSAILQLLFDAGQYERAEQIIDRDTNEAEKHDRRNRITLEAVRRGHIEQAKYLLEKHKPAWIRFDIQGFSRSIIHLVKVGEIELATNIALHLSQAEDRASLLLELALQSLITAWEQQTGFKVESHADYLQSFVFGLCASTNINEKADTQKILDLCALSVDELQNNPARPAINAQRAYVYAFMGERAKALKLVQDVVSDESFQSYTLIDRTFNNSLFPDFYQIDGYLTLTLRILGSLDQIITEQLPQLREPMQDKSYRDQIVIIKAIGSKTYAELEAFLNQNKIDLSHHPELVHLMTGALVLSGQVDMLPAHLARYTEELSWTKELLKPAQILVEAGKYEQASVVASIIPMNWAKTMLLLRTAASISEAGDMRHARSVIDDIPLRVFHQTAVKILDTDDLKEPLTQARLLNQIADQLSRPFDGESPFGTLNLQEFIQYLLEGIRPPYLYDPFATRLMFETSTPLGAYPIVPLSASVQTYSVSDAFDTTVGSYSGAYARADEDVIEADFAEAPSIDVDTYEERQSAGIFPRISGRFGRQPRQLERIETDFELQEQAPPAPEMTIDQALLLARKAHVSERYSDYSFFMDNGQPLLLSASDQLASGSPLRVGQKYWLEVAVRHQPVGIPVKGERKPVAEPKRTEPITLYVALDGDEFDIADSVKTIVLPPEGDSTQNALFNLMPTRELSNEEKLPKLKVRIYQDFNLIESVTIEAEVVGKFEDDTHSQIGLSAPVTFHHEHRGEYLDDHLPRAMQVDVSRKNDVFELTFTFKNEVEQQIVFKAKLTLSDDDLFDLTSIVRHALLSIVSIDVLERQIDIVDPQLLHNQMRTLARCGRKLWIKLFMQNGEDDELWNIGQWLEEHPLKRGSIIQVTVGAGAEKFVFPWNLLYDQPISTQDDDQAVSPDGFWGNRYVIEQMLPDQRKLADSPKPTARDHEMACFLWNFTGHAEHLATLKAVVSDAGGHLNPDQPINSPQLAYTLLHDCNSNLLYFYTHGYTRSLDKDRNESANREFIQLYESLPVEHELRTLWKELYENTKSHRYIPDESWIQLSFGKLLLDDLYFDRNVHLNSNPVVFLNMCNSAQITPSLSDSFIQFFINRKARCVLGTECTMRPVFARHFAERIMQAYFGDNKAIGFALLETRQHFMNLGNPLGLVYTLFGQAT